MTVPWLDSAIPSLPLVKIKLSYLEVLSVIQVLFLSIQANMSLQVIPSYVTITINDGKNYNPKETHPPIELHMHPFVLITISLSMEVPLEVNLS